jgi:leucyl aminopeptidase
MKIFVTSKINKEKSLVGIAFNEKISESRFVVDKNGQQMLEIKPIAEKDYNLRHLILMARQIVFFSKRHDVKKIILDWKEIDNLKLKEDVGEIAETLAVNFEMANYEFTKYKTKPKQGWNFVEEIRISVGDKNFKKIEPAVKKGQLIGKEVNASRELSNIPGGEMTPKLLAQEIKKSIKGTSVKIKVLGAKEMKKLKMGAILGVSYGSCEESKFIILEYNGNKDKKPIVLVGKAITFDTGGLSLKPADSMSDMHLDMAGGAAVAHAIIAAAKLKIKKRIIALIPAAENMPSGESYRPGDILKSMSGKTIEVLNTDAEGRIILADALTYAERYDPSLVVDVATLTGAAVIALGERASAIFSKDEKLSSDFRELGEKSGDYVWPMPLWDEYEAEIKGVNGDLANIKVEGNSRYGGAITGAVFLYQFAKKFKKWIHIDIAPKTTAVFDEFLAKGATGAPIRLLVKLMENYK